MEKFLYVFLVWMAMGSILFLGSMAEVSPFPGSTKKKVFWKWSLLLTVYACVPFFGWMLGAIHVYYTWKHNRRFKGKK